MMPPLPPGATIGILGGGQLGRMSAMAAAQLGYHVHIYTDTLTSPAVKLATQVTHGSYDDSVLLEAFARSCDVISFEFENISSKGVQQIEAFCPVRPSRHILEISQNRISEKTRLQALGFPVVPWCGLYNVNDLQKLEALGFPLILKTARFGYDGKGQYRLADRTALNTHNLPYPLVAERQVDFVREISVMVVRNEAGVCRCFDPSENHHRDGILRVSVVPASIMPALAEKAQFLAAKLAEELGLIGIMGVEFFHNREGDLLINEIAPRPHNSGHWTMDACPVDQFEMHIRAVAGLPLPSSKRHSDVFMHNLIGPEDIAFLPQIFEESGTCVHLYGKKESRKGRKMGHVNRLFSYGGLPVSSVLETLLPPLG